MMTMSPTMVMMVIPAVMVMVIMAIMRCVLIAHSGTAGFPAIFVAVVKLSLRCSGKEKCEGDQ